METVFCECKNCDAPVGRFVNLWTQIGKSYFSPVVEPEDDLAIQSQGAVRIGERGTLVEECHLQDFVCQSCSALLGIRCIQTPVNHVLDENQLLLRLASVELLDSDGQEIEFAIKRVLSVNQPSKVNKAPFPEPPKGTGFTSVFPNAVELQQLQIDIHAQSEDIKRIDSNGFRIVSVLDKRTSRIEGEVTKLRGAMGVVHRDIGGLQRDLGSIKTDIGKVRTFVQDPTTLTRLDDRLAAVTTTLGEMGQQLATLDAQFQKEMGELKSELGRQQQEMEDLKSKVRGSVAAADHTEDMAVLRAELEQLRGQMEDMRAQGAGRVQTAFPSRELEVLTSNIAKIGNRANQVESLQMELEMLKGRVERAEANRQAADDRWPTRTIDSGGLPGYSDVFPSMRKRAASPGLESLPKRPASSVGHSDVPDRRYATPPTWPVIPSTTANREDGKRGRKSSQGRPPSISNGTTSRLRKR